MGKCDLRPGHPAEPIGVASVSSRSNAGLSGFLTCKVGAVQVPPSEDPQFWSERVGKLRQCREASDLRQKMLGSSPGTCW